MDKITIVTYNVRGLVDSKTRREKFYYLHHKKFNVMFLQEVHCTKGTDKLWATEWGSRAYFAHGTSNARGVAILFSPQTKVTIKNIDRDSDGRYIIISCILNDHSFLLVNVYALNTDDPDFFKKLFHTMSRYSADYNIVGGDLNLGLDPLVDHSGFNSQNNDKSAAIVNLYVVNNEMLDVWRVKHPDCNGFT